MVLVGNDPASMVYVNNKKKACEKVGILSRSYELPEDTEEKDLLALVEQLNMDNSVHGVLVQLPLPPQIDEEKVILAVDPQKRCGLFPSFECRPAPYRSEGIFGPALLPVCWN